MKIDDLNKDDFLGKLIQQTNDCCPSDDFVNSIMTKCYQIENQEVVESKFKLALPWITAVTIFVILFGLTFVFGGGILYQIFSGIIGSTILKGLTTMTYIGLAIGGISGIILIINNLKQNLEMRVV